MRIDNSLVKINLGIGITEHDFDCSYRQTNGDELCDCSVLRDHIAKTEEHHERIKMENNDNDEQEAKAFFDNGGTSIGYLWKTMVEDSTGYTELPQSYQLHGRIASYQFVYSLFSKFVATLDGTHPPVEGETPEESVKNFMETSIKDIGLFFIEREKENKEIAKKSKHDTLDNLLRHARVSQEN